MVYDILLKSVSNKRWVKKLYETNPSNKTLGEIRDTRHI